MSEPKVLHPSGEWLRNTGAFPLYDPDGDVVLPAGVVVKAKFTEWLKGQSTVVLAENPWPTPVKEGGKAGALRAA